MNDTILLKYPSLFCNLEEKMKDELFFPDTYELLDKQKELEEKENLIKTKIEEINSKEKKLEFLNNMVSIKNKNDFVKCYGKSIVFTGKINLQKKIDKLLIGEQINSLRSNSIFQLISKKQIAKFDIIDNDEFLENILNCNISNIYIGNFNFSNTIKNFLHKYLHFNNNFIIDQIQIIIPTNKNIEDILKIIINFNNYKKICVCYNYYYDYSQIIFHCKKNNIVFEYL